MDYLPTFIFFQTLFLFIKLFNNLLIFNEHFPLEKVKRKLKMNTGIIEYTWSPSHLYHFTNIIVTHYYKVLS